MIRNIPPSQSIDRNNRVCASSHFVGMEGFW